MWKSTFSLLSYTFERVQENSEKVWRFFRYDLIFEYFDRPALAAPLIIVNHGFRIFAYFCGKATGSNFDTDFGKYNLIQCYEGILIGMC